MSYGQVFETISDAPQETEVLELLRTGAEVARKNARKHVSPVSLRPNLSWSGTALF